MLVKSAADMRKFALGVAKNMRGGEVLLLTGPLGAGKTTFVQGLAKALGTEEQITSPTFTVVGEYNLYDDLTLVHVDLYRLGGDAPSDPAVRDVLERMSGKNIITVIEWAEYLPVKSLRDHGVKAQHIFFEYGGAIDERVVTVE